MRNSASLIASLKVWCHHKFNLPGILLHDTHEHRATAARAPNESLQFDVRSSLPWLSLKVRSAVAVDDICAILDLILFYCSLPSSVSFSQIDGIPDTVLQGEVVKATMTIRNYGRAPAGSIYLRSNMPWVYVGEVRSKRSNLHTHHKI